MSEAKLIRPGQVTMAGWLVIVGSVVVVLTVSQQLGSLHTVEMRETVDKALGQPPLRGLDLTVEGALRWMRVLSMVAAGCATAAAVLGWHVLRRNRGARIALTVVAVPLFFTGLVAGGFFSSLVAASALMLWSRPARDWFDGITRSRAEVVHPSVRNRAPQQGPGADRGADPGADPGSDPGYPPGYGQGTDPRFSLGPNIPLPPFPGFGEPRPAPAPVVRRRPDQVLWACLLTWGFCAVTLMVLGVSALALLSDGDRVIADARKQSPDLEAAGFSDRDLLIGIMVMLAGLIVWTVAAMVVAAFVWRGQEWARIALGCSAGLAAGLGLIAVIASAYTFPLLIATGVSVWLLFGRQAAAWCRRPPVRPGPPGPPGPPSHPGPPQPPY